MKIVLLDEGGYIVSFSKKVYQELGFKWNTKWSGVLRNEDFYPNDDILWPAFDKYRSDKRLIHAIEKIGLKKSQGRNSRLKIVEIPDDVEYYIECTEDGTDIIHEKHRTWS